jgi:acetylornithine deacetylase
MKYIQQTVLNKIEDRADATVEFLQAIVRQPSVRGNERGAQELVYRKLRSLGLPAERWEPRLDVLARHPAFAPVEWDYHDRPNVSAVLKGSGGGRSVVLNGHIDVVPPEPLHGWSFDPWGAEIRDGRLYGRGAGDMKGGIAMIVLAVEALQAAGVKLKGDVFLESVIEEECGGNGTLACRLRGYSQAASAAVVTEPHGLHYGKADLGILWFRMIVHGVSAHVADAHKHGNVIEACCRLMQALRGLEAEMNAEPRHPLYQEHPHPVNLNIGMVRGGHWPSSVPSDCTFECRLSYQPGVQNSAVRERIEACLRTAAASDPLLQAASLRVEYYGLQSEPCVYPTEGEFIQTLGRAHQEVTGSPLLGLAGTGTTDARYFTLYSDIPATCYGPVAGNIHAADEYVELDSIVTAAKTLALFLLDWCGVE